MHEIGHALGLGLALVVQRNVAPAEELFAVQQRMNENNLGALPVADRGNFLGLITNRDISELYRLASNEPDLLPATRTRLQVES